MVTKSENYINPGYFGLLCNQMDQHVTVFFCYGVYSKDIADYLSNSIPINLSKKIIIELFIPDIDEEALLNKVRHCIIGSLDNYYFSCHLIIRKHELLAPLLFFCRKFKNFDIARLELPPEGINVTKDSLLVLAKKVCKANYAQQLINSNNFFSLLEFSDPYRIICTTADKNELIITDKSSWFDMAGPLSPGSERILPGGEVAYTGSKIDGTFVVDGGLLATAISEDGIKLALAITDLSKRFESEPLYMNIRSGFVKDVWSDSLLFRDFLKLLPLNKYSEVTEVGISFNNTCAPIIHTWPAASNEGVPGVHIALGGDPENSDASFNLGVHVDLISTSAKIKVNDIVFFPV